MIEQPKVEIKEVPIVEPKPKALVAQENMSEVDWSTKFDDEPVTYSMIAMEEFDWSTAFDEEPGYTALEVRDALGCFDWSMEPEEEPVVTNSEGGSTGTIYEEEPILCAMVVTSPSKSTITKVCSKCDKVYQNLLKEYVTERDNCSNARVEVVAIN